MQQHQGCVLSQIQCANPEEPPQEEEEGDDLSALNPEYVLIDYYKRDARSSFILTSSSSKTEITIYHLELATMICLHCLWNFVLKLKRSDNCYSLFHRSASI